MGKFKLLRRPNFTHVAFSLYLFMVPLALIHAATVGTSTSSGSGGASTAGAGQAMNISSNAMILSNLQSQTNHLANIDNWLTYQSNGSSGSVNLNNLYTAMGMNYLNQAYSNDLNSILIQDSVIASNSNSNSNSNSGSTSSGAPNANLSTSPIGLNSFWMVGCADANSPIYQVFGNPIASQNDHNNQIISNYSSTSKNIGGQVFLDTTCEQILSQGNPNNIIPLVMPSSQFVWSPPINTNISISLPSSSSSSSSSSGQSGAPNSQQALGIGIANTVLNNLTPQVSNATQNSIFSPQNLAQITNSTSSASSASGSGSGLSSNNMIPSQATMAYINALLSNTSNNIPEMALVSNTMQAVAQDYQSGKMYALNQAVGQSLSQNWQNNLVNANTPQLLRMLILELAVNNQIKVTELTQNQRNTVLLSAVLADLVKLNQSNQQMLSALGSVNAQLQQNGSISSLLLGAVRAQGAK